ncbi:MAG: UDP-3-O-(3-hydroxymyristoyl)glucosamine N-acyltransferase [Bacteroidales bacterium]
MKLRRSYTLYEIAEWLNLNYSGDENIKITGISDVYHANYGDITFADNSKYYEIANNSNASVIIVQDNTIEPNGKGIIYCNDAFETYNKLASYFFPKSIIEEQISPNAPIGKATQIYPNVYIGDDVLIGENCIIYPNVVIYGPCIIGNNVIINAGVVIGSEAFYFKKDESNYLRLNSVGSVVIESDVEIGAKTTIDKGLGGTTIIGNGTKIGNSVQIGFDTVIGKNCFIAPQTGIASNVIIEDEVVIWGQVGIQKNVIIGKEAIILGQSGVTKSVEGGKIYFGLPAVESREKMRELAYIKQIPELIKLLSEKL